MRILLDCRMASWTDAGPYTVGLTRALAARGDLDLICVVAKDEPAPATGVSRIETMFNPLTPQGMLEFGALQEKTRQDVTHCLHATTPFPVRRPLAVTVSDVTALATPDPLQPALQRIAYRWRIGRVARFAQAIICPSEDTTAELERHFPASRKKTTVIPEDEWERTAEATVALYRELRLEDTRR